MALAKPVLKALSDSHLRAIGLVAAQWADLEWSIMFILSKAFKLDFKHAVILAGAQNPEAWCRMINKLLYPQPAKGDPKIKRPLDKITDKIIKLSSKRNAIVHTSWFPPQPIAGGLFSLGSKSVPARPKAGEAAEGAALPKRNPKIFLNISYNATQMLEVANEIAKVELELLSWWRQQPKTNLLAEMLRTHASPPTLSKTAKPAPSRKKSSAP